VIVRINGDGNAHRILCKCPIHRDNLAAMSKRFPAGLRANKQTPKGASIRIEIELEDWPLEAHQYRQGGGGTPLVVMWYHSLAASPSPSEQPSRSHPPQTSTADCPQSASASACYQSRSLLEPCAQQPPLCVLYAPSNMDGTLTGVLGVKLDDSKETFLIQCTTEGKWAGVLGSTGTSRRRTVYSRAWYILGRQGENAGSAPGHGRVPL
jgi:hypothetical protein